MKMSVNENDNVLIHILRICCVLVSTDVAAMGLDVNDLNMCVNIGLHGL